jgi:transcriptional regulator with XRE-family HTH domain
LTLLRQQLATLPVHGPNGRVAALRAALRLRQVDLARAINERGGHASRETVSRWENFDAAGIPRSRVSRRNAEVLAAIARDRLEFPATPEVFYEPAESPWDSIARLQLETVARIQLLTDTIRDLSNQLSPEKTDSL